MSSAKKLITVYFILTYGIPMAGNLAFADKIIPGYYVYPLGLAAFLTIVGTFGGFLILALRSSGSIALNVPLPRRFLRVVGDAYLRWRFYVALAIFALSVGFLLNGLNGHRYSDAGLSETGSKFLLLVDSLSVLVVFDFFFNIFLEPIEPHGWRRRVANLLMAASLIVSANGTATMLMALTLVVYSLFPVEFKSLVFVSTKDHTRRAARIAAGAAMVVIIFVLSWLAGESIKQSSSGDISAFSSATEVAGRLSNDDQFSANYGYYLIAATSSYYYSALFTADADREQLTNGEVSPLVYPIRTFSFRLYYLLGLLPSTAKPDIGTVSRLNYLLLTTDPVNTRAGTSPGLVASFGYLAPFPFSILLGALYLRLIAEMVQLSLQPHGGTVSWPGSVLLLLFVHDLFQSPVDFLTVFDESVLFFALYCCVLIARSRPRLEQTRQSDVPVRRLVPSSPFSQR